MTSPKNKPNIKIRRALVLLPLMTLFCSFILFNYLIPDFYISETNVNSTVDVIKNVYKNKYEAHDKYHGTYYPDCVDIEIFNKPFLIRLSDKSLSNYWPQIINKDNISKKIEIKYQAWLLHGNILNNPNKLSIDNITIIPITANHNLIGWFAITDALVIIAFSFWLYRIFKYYKQNLYEHDRQIGKLSKWKLFWTWLGE